MVSVLHLLGGEAAPAAGVGGGAGARAGALALALLLLHAPVLEPDLHLSLVQLQRRCDLYAARARQVLAEVELLLELGQLARAEVGAHGVVVGGQAEVRHFDWNKRKTRDRVFLYFY